MEVVTFDWHRIVQQTKPGDRTAAQQARQTLLVDVVADLFAWAHAFQLPTKRVEVSAYIGAIGVTEPTLVDQARVLAKYTFWLFVFDTYLDTLQYDYPVEAVEARMAQLDQQIAPIVDVFVTVGGMTIEQFTAHRLVLPATDAAAWPNAATSLGVALRQAYLDLYESLQMLWDAEPHAEAPFCLYTFLHETAIVLGVMREEVEHSFIFQATGVLPSLDAYLERSRFSVCLRAAGTIALGFELDPRAVWEPWMLAMVPSMKALRLINDMATFEHELIEQKVTSITITMVENGLLPYGAYTSESPEIVHVKTILQARRDAELERFAQLTAQGIPDGPLAFYVFSASAFTIAMYAHGDFIAPQ